MKNIIFTCLLFIITASIAYGQGNRHERLKAMKTAFITEKLELTPSDAEKFWPIYNDHEKKLFKLKVLKRREWRKEIREKGGIETLSEEEAAYYINNSLQIEENILDEKKKFYLKLKETLSSKQILKLYNAEREFNKKLLYNYRHKNRNEKKLP